MPHTLAIDKFMELPDEDVAQLIRPSMTCLLGINGSTRWFYLENPMIKTTPYEQFLRTYTAVTSQRLAEVCEMLFRHGVHTVLIPVLNQTLFDGRNPEYARMMCRALPNITSGGVMDDLYTKYAVRVGFYGAYENALLSSGDDDLLDSFAHTIDTTHKNDKRQILWGVFAQDEVTAAIDLSIKSYEKHHRYPSEADLIASYYGFHVSPVDMYITSGKPRLFDAPFVMNGQTDMYFMVPPSLYLSRNVFRRILFDHLYSRRGEKDYGELNQVGWSSMKQFYQSRMDTIMGVGEIHPDWKTWFPDCEVSSI